jgi:hypothetical protein
VAAVRRRDRQFHVNEVRLGPNTYRVFHPARPIAHGALYETRLGAEMSVDKAATIDLALAWWLAARSPHSLVYLPLRSSACDIDAHYRGRRLDLVLLHHSLAFPASRWKDVRSRLTPTGLQKVTLPENPFRHLEYEEHMRVLWRGYRDRLDHAVAADTLFVIGSRPAYEQQAETVLELVDDAPAELAAKPDAHTCGEIGLGDWHGRGAAYRRRDAPWNMHVVCCNDHW